MVAPLLVPPPAAPRAPCRAPPCATCTGSTLNPHPPAVTEASIGPPSPTATRHIAHSQPTAQALPSAQRHSSKGLTAVMPPPPATVPGPPGPAGTPHTARTQDRRRSREHSHGPALRATTRPRKVGHTVRRAVRVRLCAAHPPPRRRSRMTWGVRLRTPAPAPRKAPPRLPPPQSASGRARSTVCGRTKAPPVSSRRGLSFHVSHACRAPASTAGTRSARSYGHGCRTAVRPPPRPRPPSVP